MEKDAQRVLSRLPIARLRLLAGLGHEAARALISDSVSQLVLDRRDEAPTWEAFAWWFDGLEKLDPSGPLAAGVVVGQLLLATCETAAHAGDLQRIVDALRTAWEREAGKDCLRGMAARIQRMNELECEFDTGGEMPPERLATRALTQLGLEFTGDGSEEAWMANAVEGLECATGLDRFAIEDQLKSGIVTMVLADRVHD